MFDIDKSAPVPRLEFHLNLMITFLFINLVMLDLLKISGDSMSLPAFVCSGGLCLVAFLMFLLHAYALFRCSQSGKADGK